MNPNSSSRWRQLSIGTIAALAAAACVALWLHDGDAPFIEDWAEPDEAIEARQHPSGPQSNTETRREPTASKSVVDATESLFSVECVGRNRWGLPTVGGRPALGLRHGCAQVYVVGSERGKHGGGLYSWRSGSREVELIVDVGHLRSVTAYAGIPLTLWGGEVLPAAGVDGSVAAPRASWSIREFREGAFSEAEEAHYYDIPQVGSSALPPRTDGEPLTVVVRDSAGVAVVDAVVELRKNGVLIADSTVGDGVYHFDGVPAGDCQIYVGRLPGFVRIEEIVFNDESKRFEIDLTARASCKGRVVDDGGNPVSGVRVLSWNTSGRWDNWVVTDADGLFEVAADDEDTCRVWACVPGQGLRWPACGMLISSNTRELGDLKIAPQRCRGKLIVRCPRLVGLDWSAATVRVWQESSGIGLRAVALEDPGVFVSQDMPAGRYLVEMYAPGVGLQKLGSITSTGDTAVELDAVLVGVGTVNLTLRDKPTPMGGRWLARRYGNGWRQVELRANSDTLMLAEGEYSIGDGESRDLASGVAFYVGTGSRCVVELDDDRRQ